MSERFVGDGRLRLSGRNDAPCTECHGIRGTRATRCHRHSPAVPTVRNPLPGRRRPCLGQVCAASARAGRAIYGDTVTWRKSRPWALSAPRSPGRAITNRAARRAQPARAPSVGEQPQPRPLLWLVRTHCGLGRICGSRRILNRRDHGRDDLRKPRAGLLGFEAVTCGSDIHDSPSTRHEFRDKSRRHEAGRTPVSSANVAARTTGGPRRVRTDDLRIKGPLFWFVRTLADCGRFRLS